MSIGHPTPPAKPAKPYPAFPLFPHATGRWAKKIRGKLHYFGKWADTDSALASYMLQASDLHAGRTPQTVLDRLTMFTLCGRFLTSKKALMDAGELSGRSFEDYADTCQRILACFGKHRAVVDLRPSDFEQLRTVLAKTWGPIRLGNAIVRVRGVFRYGVNCGLMDKPMLFGEGFKRPSRKMLRRHRAAQGVKMFAAEEIRQMFAAASQPLKAMVLLGVNCGFGNSDCGTLPLSALDLAGGWVTYPRPKTGIDRRCPLWPETIAALKEWLAERPEPKTDAAAKVVFVTKYGLPWAKECGDNPVSQECRKLLDTIGIDGHRNFYALRHSFQTIGDESGDFLAVRSIMGHATNDIADNYRERMSDARLRKVTEHVRGWLFGEVV